MKKLYFGVGTLAFAAAVAAVTASQIRSQAIASFESDFSKLKTVFAKASHGPVEFDIWQRNLTVRDVTLQPANADEASATRIAKLTAVGVSQRGDRVAAEKLTIEGFATTIEPMSELSGRIRYEAPTISIEQFSSNGLPASSGVSTLAWTRQVLTGMTAAAIAVPTLTSVTDLQSATVAAGAAPSSRVDQILTNIRFEGVRNGKVAKATLERLRATSQLPPPAPGDLVVETGGGYVTDYDLAATFALLDQDAPNSAPGFTTLWRTAGSGPITVKGGQALNMSISGVVTDGIAIDIVKLRAALKAVQENGAKAGRRPTPAQTQAMLTALTGLYESVNLATLEYKDMVVEVPGVPPTKFGLMRLDRLEKGTLAKFTLEGLDGATPQGGKFHLDHFALEKLSLAQMMRISAEASANPAAAQPAQAGWAMLQTLGGLRLDGLVIPMPDDPGASGRIDTLQAKWGEFVGSMPMSGEFKLKAQMPLGAKAQEPLASLAKLGVRDSAISFDGKWKWNEATRRADIGPISTEVAGAGVATLSLGIGNIPRAVLDGGPMMLAIAMPQFKLATLTLDLKDLGLGRLVKADAAAAAQLEQGIQALRSSIDALPPEKSEQRALLEAALRFLSTPGSSLSLSFKPKGDVGLGALLGANQGAPQMLEFLTEQMTTTVTVTP